MNQYPVYLKYSSSSSIDNDITLDSESATTIASCENAIEEAVEIPAPALGLTDTLKRKGKDAPATEGLEWVKSVGSKWYHRLRSAKKKTMWVGSPKVDEEEEIYESGSESGEEFEGRIANGPLREIEDSILNQLHDLKLPKGEDSAKCVRFGTPGSQETSVNSESTTPKSALKSKYNSNQVEERFRIEQCDRVDFNDFVRNLQGRQEIRKRMGKYLENMRARQIQEYQC